MKKLFFKILTAISIALAVPAAAFAHNYEASFEQTVGNYFVDIGYSGTVTGQAIHVDFNLLEAKTKSVIPFGDVWARVSKGQETLFAGPIASGEFGVPGMSIVFPEAGTYDISIRFENGEDSIAETDFPLTITGPSVGAVPWPLLWGEIGLVALVFCGLGFWIGQKAHAKKHSHKNEHEK